MLTSVRHLSFSPFEEGRPPFVEACIGVLATQLFGTSTGGREGVSTCKYNLYKSTCVIYNLQKIPRRGPLSTCKNILTKDTKDMHGLINDDCLVVVVGIE